MHADVYKIKGKRQCHCQTLSNGNVFICDDFMTWLLDL